MRRLVLILSDFKNEGMESQEIWHKGSVVLALGTLGDCLEDNEVPICVLIEMQQGGLVVHSVAVVRRRPQSHQLLIEPIYVPLLDQLVGADY